MENKITLPGRKLCAVNLYKIGTKPCIISKVTNLSISTIKMLVKHKTISYNRKKRKSLITTEMGEFLKIFFKRHSTYTGGSLSKATQRLNEEFATSIKSVKPVRNWLKINKFKAKNKILFDPYPKRIIMKRLAFCRKFVKDLSISKKNLFTDEKTFQLRSKHHKSDKMWVSGNSKYHNQEAILYNNDYVKISAGISVFGKTKLIFLPSKFNGKVYSEDVLPIFKEEIQKHHLKYFMQDNSSIHYEKKFVLKKLDEFKEILNWPPRSPDLNPIENLWAYLSQKLKYRKCENLRQLKFAIQEEYQKIPDTIIYNLCNSFHSRLKRCIDGKGKMI